MRPTAIWIIRQIAVGLSYKIALVRWGSFYSYYKYKIYDWVWEGWFTGR